MVVAYLGFDLIQQAPLFIPGSVEGNWISMRYLPGRLLNRAFDEAGILRVDVPDTRLIVLNAYPALHGRRTLPVPLSWRWQHTGDEEVNVHPEGVEFEVAYHDLSAYSKAASAAISHGDFPDVPRYTAGGNPITDKFFSVTDDGEEEFLHFHSPIMQVSPDLAQGQRPVVCLAPGNEFQGLVQVEAPDESALDKAITQLRANSTVLFVGMRRHAGFGGRLQLKWASGTQDQEGRFYSDAALEDLKEGQLVRLIFTARVVSPQGQTFADTLKNTFGERFDVTGIFTARVFEKGMAGKGSTWQAGSVAVLSVKQNMTISELRGMQHRGVGEFTELGYGRFMALRKAEEALEYGYWTPWPVYAVPGKDMDAVSGLRDKVVDTMVNKAADIQAAAFLKRGFSGRIPDVPLLAGLYESVKNGGLEGLGKALSTMDDAQRQALAGVPSGDGTSILTFLSDLAESRGVKGLARYLDLDALSARKSPKGMRAGAGKHKKALLARAGARIAEDVLLDMIRAAMKQEGKQ